jgi:1-acyl-sn-glycerol-3-phosphate acyltransferase
MVVYRAVRSVLSAGVNVFFRDIQLVGLDHVPGEGPVVFVGNHPNSLIDPVMLVVSSGRVVHFAAKDKLFQFPMGLVLDALGAVPIARKMDRRAGESVDNAAAFSAMYQVLEAGRSVGIFPEGLSHDESHLARLRSGAARVALDAAERNPGARVRVVPCGLTYMRRKNVRSRVLVQFGAPLEMDAAWIERWRADPREAGTALTTEIERALRALTINTSDWETLRVLDGCRRLYQPPHISLSERVELSRRFCEVYEDIREEPDAVALRARMVAYLARLDAAGLTDRDLVRGLDRKSLVLRSLDNVLRLCVWLPLALPGAPLHAPLLLGISWVGVSFSPRKDVIGTSKLLVGMLGVLATYVLVPLAVLYVYGAVAAGALGLLLPLSGLATLRVLERWLTLRRLARSAFLAPLLGRELAQLVALRRTLEAAVVEAVGRFKPAEMEPLFPREEL